MPRSIWACMPYDCPYGNLLMPIWLLDHMIILFLALWGTSMLFSTVPTPTNIPTNGVGVLPFSIPSLALVVCRCFNDGHFDLCDLYKVVPHCSFYLPFSINYRPMSLLNMKFKNPQQNISKLSPTIYKKNHTAWSSWIYSRVTRMVQYMEISQCDIPY